MVLGFQCPRGDLGCAAAYATTGELDDHTRRAHLYYKADRFLQSFSVVRPVAVSALNSSPYQTALPAGAQAGPPELEPSGTSAAATAAVARHGSAADRETAPATGHSAPS